MAAELLQLLDFARSQDAQNALQASVAQNANCINQHATIINQHTADLAQLTTTTQQQDRSIRILAANDDGTPGYGTRNSGSCWLRSSSSGSPASCGSAICKSGSNSWSPWSVDPPTP